jgi:PAP2 superfamily
VFFPGKQTPTVILFLLFYPDFVLSFLLVLCCIVRWQLVPQDRKRAEYALVILMFTYLLTPIAGAVARRLSSLRPLKLDLYAYQFDQLFGQPSFVLSRIMLRHYWLEILLLLAYGLVSVAVAVVLIAYVYYCESQTAFAIKVFLLDILAAPVMYALVPICGPAFAFPSFPKSPGIVAVRSIPLLAAPNGFPSIHTSIALLVLWFAWRWRIGKVLGSIYLALIIFSTLASGQHYLLDLFAAVPYTLGVLFAVKWMSQPKILPVQKAHITISSS